MNTFDGVSHVTNVTAIATDAGGRGLVADSTSADGICVPPFGVESHAV